MKKAVVFLHVAMMTLFTLSLFFVLKSGIPWVAATILGLLIGLGLSVGFFGIAVAYMVIVFVLGLLPAFPLDSLLLLGLPVLAWWLIRFSPFGKEVSGLLLGVISSLLFYLFVYPMAFVEDLPFLVMSVLVAGLYAFLVALYPPFRRLD